MKHGCADHVPDIIAAVQHTDCQLLAYNSGCNGMGYGMGASEVNDIGQHAQKRLLLILGKRNLFHGPVKLPGHILRQTVFLALDSQAVQDFRSQAPEKP